MIVDCAVIGGGPAGLSAALVLGRARRRVALFDSNKPRNAVTHESHGFLTRDGINPMEFRRIAYEEVLQYPSVIHKKETVLNVEMDESIFRVTSEKGDQLLAKKLVLATGLRETFPTIKGFEQFYGQSVFNCPYCDGWEMKGKSLVVVSEREELFHYVKMVYHWSKDVIVCTNGKPNLTTKQIECLQSKGLRIVEKNIDSFMGTEGMLQKIRFDDGETIDREGGFVMPVWSQSSSLGNSIGCECSETGNILTDSQGRTTVQGVYAAGDAAGFSPSQLIVAAAQGSVVAMAVNADLIEEEF